MFRRFYLSSPIASNHAQNNSSANLMSQTQLAETSGVPVRSIQQYEQRRKDINKSNANTLLSLARALGCRMEDLLEL